METQRRSAVVLPPDVIPAMSQTNDSSDNGCSSNVAKAHAASPAMSAFVTVHAVLGHGAYPYNVMRNVALAPFAPWAAGRGNPAPWVLLADADGVPSVGEARFADVMRATTRGSQSPSSTCRRRLCRLFAIVASRHSSRSRPPALTT